VAELSRGIPRLINVLCDRALLGAYVEEKEQVDLKIVNQAAREVLGGRYTDRGFRFLREISATRILLTLFLIILGILAGSFYYGRWQFIARTEQVAQTQPIEKPAPAEQKTGINVGELQEISPENK
jgi:general secretion pathway protein A